jgi:hypothetical protein
MFIWVVVAAAVIGAALVLSLSLFERLSFNQKIIDEKSTTVNNLRDNNEVVDELKDNARVLNTDPSLAETPRPEGRQPISVILDALPSQANSSALGASLQQKLLNDNVSIESLTVEPIEGAEDGEGELEDDEVQEITFDFTVSAGADQADALRAVLRKMERSIRTINVTALEIEQQNSKISLSVEGVAYFLPEKRVELEKERVRP